MPWWSWILIWVGLVLILLGMLVLLALQLWRKARMLTHELHDLKSLLAELEERAAQLVPEEEPRPNAILRGLSDVERERRQLLEELGERRESRRRARLARATMIIRADPERYASIVRRK